MEKDPRHLLEEQELVVGQAPFWTRQVLKAFPAFRHENYRLFFMGQLISLVGTWMHIVALGWLVLEMTKSAFWVSFVLGLDALPVLFFSLPAGILADRLKRRRLLIWTQIAAMTIVFLLGLLVSVTLINLPLVILLTFLLGVSLAFEMPTRQTLIFDVVGRKDIASAVALNVGMFNSARVVGPAISGLIVAAFNIQTAFFLNAVSFLAIIIALRKMRLPKFVPEKNPSHLMADLREGLTFAKNNRVIRLLLLIVGFNSLIPWGYGSLLPTITKQVFQMDSFGYGILLSAAGIGALIAAIVASAFAHKLSVENVIGWGSFSTACALLAFSFTTSFFLALPILLILGISLFMQVALANATIQKASPDYIRGRIISVYAFVFLGAMPIGNFLTGLLTQFFPLLLTLRIMGIVTLLGVLFYLLLIKPQLTSSLKAQTRP